MAKKKPEKIPQSLLANLRAKVADAAQREVRMNLHLGNDPDRDKGSLIVYVRWDDLERLLDAVEGKA